MNELRLFTIDLPEEVVFPEEPNASGSQPECPECGMDWMKGWDDERGGWVWNYHVYNEGVAVWVRAVCRECKTVHLFTTSGGKGGNGSVRDFKDLYRKHGEEWRHHSK